jgi:hypothetical protein
MADQFEFITATDKPALLAVSTPEWSSTCELALLELGYKIHKIGGHLEFPSRYSQVPYQVVIIEEKFGGGEPSDNTTLHLLQHMQTNQRRHSAIILIGESFETLNALQAFQHSVHAVVNYSEMGLIGQLVQKTVADNDLFLHNFREIQLRVAQAKQ